MQRAVVLASSCFLAQIGACMPSLPCDRVECPVGQVCEAGRCVTGDPCGATLQCLFDDLAHQPADSIRFRPISRWPRTTLTWRMSNFLPELDQNGQTLAAARALSRWSVESSLVFKLVTDDADITISFEQGDHGDDVAFDDTEVLGHVFFPSTRNAGQVHLNFDQNWALSSLN